jgi:hypothetical protein
MGELKYLLTSGVLKRGWLANLLRQFKSPVPTQLAPFPKCLSPGVSPGVYTARLTAKTLRGLVALDTSRSFIEGVSTGEIR